MSPLSVIFCGTPEFAVPHLQALIADDRFSVTAVITQPDRPVGRKQILTPPPVKVLAEEHNIPVYQPESLNKEFSIINSQFSIPPDFLVVVAYGQILSQAVLDWPRIAPINVHGSLLPHLRGAAPIQCSILQGDTETGVTVQRMVKALDAGDIYAQASTPIGPRETFPELYDRLATLGAQLLPNTLANLPAPQPQDESRVTICSKLSRDDGKVDTQTMTAEEIDRKVRALNPWPGVTMTINGETLKILETSLEPAAESAPLECKDGSMLYLTKIQKPGGKPTQGSNLIQ